MIPPRALEEPVDAALLARQFVATALLVSINPKALVHHTWPPHFWQDCSRTVTAAIEINKVAGLVRSGIAQAGWSVPADVDEFLDLQHKSIIAKNLENLIETSHVCAIFERAGIDFVVLKGAVRSHQVFGALDARPSGDIDILVGCKDYANAGRVLCENGYVRGVSETNDWWHKHLGEAPFVPLHSRCIVDVHHKVQQPGGAAPRYLDDFIMRRTTVSAAGREFCVLHPDDALLLAYISISKAMRKGEVWLGYAAEIERVRGQMSEAQLRQFFDVVEHQGMARMVSQIDGVIGAVFSFAQSHLDRRQLDNRILNLASAAFGTHSGHLGHLHRSRLLWQWTSGKGVERLAHFLAMTGERIVCDVRRPRSDRTAVGRGGYMDLVRNHKWPFL